MKNTKAARFIKSPWVIISTATIVILVSFLFNISFKKPPQVHPQALFLENVMIREWGLYTLLGSKPITIFNINPFSIKTEEDLKKNYKALKADFKRQKKPFPKYKDFKKNWDANLPPFSPQELWEAWEKSSLSLDPMFLITSRPAPYGQDPLGLFVNIPNLTYLLYHYRDEFSKRTDIQYDPIQIVYEIENPKSIFWEKVFQDHFLIGLICGYGKQGSYLFELRNKNFPLVPIDKFRDSLTTCATKQDIKTQSKKDISPKDLPLPVYFHFGVTDSAKTQYEKEREKNHRFF